MMDVDDLMMVMISGGIALCGAYIRAQYMDWRNQQSAEVEKTSRVRPLYPVELSRPQERGGAGFSDTSISGFRTGRQRNRRNEVHEEAET